MPDTSEGHIVMYERARCGKYRKVRLELRTCRDPDICADGIGYAVWAQGRYLHEIDRYDDAVGLAFEPPARPVKRPRHGRSIYEQGA